MLSLLISIYFCFTNNNLAFQKEHQFPKYYEDNLRPNWTFNISKNYDQKFLHMWTEPIQVNISNPLAPGENGNAYVPLNDEKSIIDQLKGEYNFNAYASDKMSLHRSLPDYRFPECRSLVYPEKLPTASVIKQKQSFHFTVLLNVSFISSILGNTCTPQWIMVHVISNSMEYHRSFTAWAYRRNNFSWWRKHSVSSSTAVVWLRFNYSG